MPDHKYRIKLEQFVRVTGPVVLPCPKKTYDCPNSRTCTENSHVQVRVEPGPVLRMLDDLRMDLTPKITVDGKQWPVLYALRVEGYGVSLVFSEDIDRVKSELKEALESDLDYNVADDTVFDRMIGYWGNKERDRISKQAGELTVEQIFDFYVDPETGELDFGGRTTLSDIANNCAEKLAERAELAGTQSGVAGLHIAESTG